MLSTVQKGIVLTLALFLIFGSLELRLSAKSRFESVRTDEDRFYLPPSTWLKLFSLGYNEAMADLIWVQSILYFGENIRLKTKERFVINYMDSAIDLDPRFRSLYLSGSVFTLYQYRGKISKETLKMAIDILEQGHKIFPNDGEIAFNLGFMHYSDMNWVIREDKDDAEKKYHTRRGRNLIGKSAFMPGAPPYAARLSIALFSDDSMKDLRVEHLRTLLANETQPEVRKTLAANLKAALGDAIKRDIETTNRLEKQWREEMPYIPFDFYMLLEPSNTYADIVDPLEHSNRILNISE